MKANKISQGNRAYYPAKEEKLYTIEEIDREINYDLKSALQNYRANIAQRKAKAASDDILYFLGR